MWLQNKTDKPCSIKYIMGIIKRFPYVRAPKAEVVKAQEKVGPPLGRKVKGRPQQERRANFQGNTPQHLVLSHNGTHTFQLCVLTVV